MLRIFLNRRPHNPGKLSIVYGQKLNQEIVKISYDHDIK